MSEDSTQRRTPPQRALKSFPTEQEKLDKSRDRKTDAWFKAQAIELIKAVSAKYPVLTDQQDRQRRRDAGYQSGLFQYDDARDEDEVRPPWIPTATPKKILYRKHRLSDADELRAALADGPKPQREVKARFSTWSHRRLTAAKDALGIKSHRIGFGAGSYIVWELP